MLQEKKGLIVSLDQGTTSSRSILYDLNGAELKSAQCPLNVSYPQNGWVEQDPEEIWTSQSKTLLEILDSKEASSSKILSLAITNQRETVLAWDFKSGKAVSPAIVWQCRRSASFCDELINSGKKDIIKKKTGLEIDAYFSASKISWLINNIQEVSNLLKEDRVVFGTVDSWLLFKLSGINSRESVLTEPSNASRSMLFNIEDGIWDDELLKIFNIPKSSLPRVVSSTGPFPNAKINGKEIPINSVLGDQQSSLYGLGCEKPGMAKCTFGTGAFMLVNSGPEYAPVQDGLLDTVAWNKSKDESLVYAREGSVFVAGALIGWLKDIGLISSFEEAESLAKQANPDSDVVIVPSFTGLGAPIWDPSARGLIIGLTRGSKKEDIVRAAIEGVSHQVADLVDLFRNTVEINSITIDGGMSKNSVLAESLADFANAEVIVSKNSEATAFGAAKLAANFLKVGENFKISSASNSGDLKIYKPKLDDSELKRKRDSWNKAISRSQKWVD